MKKKRSYAIIPFLEAEESHLNMSWIKNVLVAIDQLGNAIAGGNPKATISGRTGYHSKHADTYLRPYWLLLEAIINFAFLPLDGPDHCLRTYDKEKNLIHSGGSDLTRIVLGTVVISCCTIIAFATRLYVFIIPSAKYETRHEDLLSTTDTTDKIQET